MASVAPWALGTLRALLPSFVADCVFPDHRVTWKRHPTSYLDGLRGLASFVVFFCHYTEENHRYLIATYGLNPDATPSSWLQLPLVRIVFSGRPMVHVFFVISGFVLSYKPLRTIHAGQLDRCFAALSSSAFRRPIRLYGPCLVETFLIVLCIQAGWLWHPLPTFSEQFWLWVDAVFHSITWPWAWDFDLRPGYDVHLWTIPIEFVHSMLLFMVILILSRLRLLVRQSAVLFLMVYCLACGKWAGFEFLGGLFLAEVHLLVQASASAKAWESSEMSLSSLPEEQLPVAEQQQQQQEQSFTAGSGSVAHTVFHVGIILTALFVGGWPNFDANRTPGIRYLLAKTPEPFSPRRDELAPQKFWFAVSAFFAVWSCGELAFVRRFLEGGVAQYCGRISYAIYIVHGPVLNMFQDHVVGSAYASAWGQPGFPEYRPAVPASGVKGIFGVVTPVQRTMSWLVGLLILGPLVVWVADVFWRAVDNPIIALAKKLELACLDDGHYHHHHPPERSPRSQGYSSVAA